ncbi:hypothetical protein LZ30DRAFT_311593 [Colletotrichum cereale]|nr:hypothetical protein LZ30DRAFT_311593 [Colletotrichum cereale]
MGVVDLIGAWMWMVWTWKLRRTHGRECLVWGHPSSRLKSRWAMVCGSNNRRLSSSSEIRTAALLFLSSLPSPSCLFSSQQSLSLSLGFQEAFRHPARSARVRIPETI